MRRLRDRCHSSHCLPWRRSYLEGRFIKQCEGWHLAPAAGGASRLCCWCRRSSNALLLGDTTYNAPMHRDRILELFQTAASDREHGAAEIEVTLIRGLLDIETGLRLKSLHKGLRTLAEGQPAMANLRAMAGWMAAVESPASCVSRLARRLAVLEELPDRFTANAWPFVENSQ